MKCQSRFLFDKRYKKHYTLEKGSLKWKRLETLVLYTHTHTHGNLIKNFAVNFTIINNEKVR